MNTRKPTCGWHRIREMCSGDGRDVCGTFRREAGFGNFTDAGGVMAGLNKYVGTLPPSSRRCAA